MIHICPDCERVIKDGERITVLISATYHMIPSKKAYALDKHDMEADASTLQHERCPSQEGD